ncbi:MAG: SMC-Scp complex subunit ScpB [Planctomycetota bacterium]
MDLLPPSAADAAVAPAAPSPAAEVPPADLAAAGEDPAPGAPAPEPPATGPGEALSDDELAQEAAALLFASSEPLRVSRLVELLGRPDPRRVRTILEALAARLAASGLPVALRSIAGGWRLLTDPALGDVVARLQAGRKPERISGAALETLAIVAYRQPVTKAEVEAIRGVQSGPLLRTLVDRRLLRVTGRADVPGSPLLYGTTREFLERFGLDRLEDLPRDGELTQN